MLWIVMVLGLVSLPSLAWAQTELQIDQSASKLVYHLVHKFHEIEGTSKSLQGRATIGPDGRAQVVVRAPVESFDSGNVNRDAHMKETVEAARFPTVELKALGDGLQPPSSFPMTVQKTFKVQLTFHGVTKIFEIPVDLIWMAPDKVHAVSKFNLSLDAFRVQRPSLLFVKVDDALQLAADVLLKR
jgi:polyisoprenoid-binding protein YceI